MRAPLLLLVTLVTIALPAPAAPRFPKPDPAAQFREWKIYDAAGHPWRAAREDWAGARERVAHDPAWQKWLAREHAELDAWIARHHDRVEWIAGWSHDGISPKDASRLTWVDRIPGEENDHFSSPSDPRVEITPKLHAWWVVGFRERHLAMMVRAAKLARLTGETRYAEWAASQLDFYADNYLKWPSPPESAPTRTGARLFWQTLSEANGLIKFADTARLLGDTAAAERRAAWTEKLFRPEVTVLNRNFQAIHNIAVWQRGAVAQVALLLGDEAMWREALDGRYGLRRQMAEGVTSDYLWWEQSLGYNAYVVQATLSLFTAAGLHGRAAELADELNIAENLMLGLLTLRFPDGKLPNPADSQAPGSAPDRGLFASAYRVFPTALGLQAAAGRRDWDTLLDPPALAPTLPALPAVTTRLLESSRMAVLRSGPWQVFVHYGQLQRSHSQPEALNWSASFDGIDVSHDTGTTGYGSPMHRGYFARGANHNVPLIDGEGEDLAALNDAKQWPRVDGVPQSPQLGRVLEFSTAPARLSVEQPRYTPHARARRTLEIAGEALVDRVELTTDDGAAHTLGFTLQLQGAAQLGSEFSAAPDFARGRPEPFGYWRDVRGAQFRDRAVIPVRFGDRTLVLEIECPGDFHLWHGDTPDVPPRRRETLFLETRGATANFTTRILPAK